MHYSHGGLNTAPAGSTLRLSSREALSPQAGPIDPHSCACEQCEFVSDALQQMQLATIDSAISMPCFHDQRLAA